jgi:hypothetical protein
MKIHCIYKISRKSSWTYKITRKAVGHIKLHENPLDIQNYNGKPWDINFTKSRLTYKNLRKAVGHIQFHKRDVGHIKLHGKPPGHIKFHEKQLDTRFPGKNRSVGAE